MTALTGTVSNRFFFTAREAAAKTGLLYYRTRYYDSSTGRFLSEDPVRVNGDINFYRYSHSSPTMYTDPTGLKACQSGRCADCPKGTWVAAAPFGEAGADYGPVGVGGLVFGGVFVCPSNPTFNVPFVTICGAAGPGFQPKWLANLLRRPPTPKPGKSGKGGVGLSSTLGAAGLRCTGVTCREGLAGTESGFFVEVGPAFGFRETGPSGSCKGGGVALGEEADVSVGYFKCKTFLGESIDFGR